MPRCCFVKEALMDGLPGAGRLEKRKIAYPASKGGGERGGFFGF
jgi:hypothetical protein